MARDYFSLLAQRAPVAVPVAQPVQAPGPQGDLKDWARRRVEKIRALVFAGRLSFLPWIDNITHETPEIRAAYREMLKDGVVWSGVRTNAISVAHQPVQVHPEDADNPTQAACAKALHWALRKVEGGTARIAMNVLIPSQMDGWSFNETVLKEQPESYGPATGRICWRAFKNKDTKYLWPLVDRYKNVVGVRSTAFNANQVYEGVDMESFVIYQHNAIFENPLGLSAFRPVYRPYWLKDTATRLWAVFLGRNATPAIKGTYSSLDQKAALEEALENFQADTWLTVPAGCMAEAMDIAERGGGEFKLGIDTCNQEILVALCGGHLPTMEGQAGAPRGDTQVQEGTTELIQWLLSATLGEVVTRQMAAPWVRFNYGPQMPCPEVAWGAVNEQEMLVSATLDEQLQKIGLPLSRKERSRYYGRQEPEDAADVLRPAASAALPPGQPGQPSPGAPAARMLPGGNLKP